MKQTWTKELFPIRRTLPLATAMEFTNGKESSLVYITPFLIIKSATNWEEECGSFFHVRKSAKPTNGFWIHSFMHMQNCTCLYVLCDSEKEKLLWLHNLGWRRWREAMSIARSREIEADTTMTRFIWTGTNNYTLCF
jgi:hypothetical protein